MELDNRRKSSLAIADTQVLDTDRLEKTGEGYALVLLSKENIGQILALQEIAFAGLTKDEKNYIHRKDRDFFEKHFAAGNDVLGMVHKGRLIAQSVIVNPTAAHPETGMPMQLENVPVDSLTVLQGVIVDPAYRGNHLMGHMVEAWLAASEKNGRTEVLAEVIPANSFSWSVFLQKGLHIESIAIDPPVNAEVYNLHGHLPSLSKTFKYCTKKSVSVPQNDIATQKKLLAAGHKGAKFDRAHGNIEFRRPGKDVDCL